MNAFKKSRLFAQSLQAPAIAPTMPVYIRPAEPFIPPVVLNSLRPEKVQPLQNTPKPITLKPKKERKYNERNAEVLRELIETDFSFLNLQIESITCSKSTRVIYHGENINPRVSSLISKKYKELAKGATKVELVKSNNIGALLDQIEHEQKARE